jgi:hypothetical protein
LPSPVVTYSTRSPSSSLADERSADAVQQTVLSRTD